MTPEELAVKQAESLTRMHAPDFGKPLERLHEILQYTNAHDMVLGDFMKTDLYASLTASEAATLHVYGVFHQIGMIAVIGGEQAALIATAIGSTMVVHGNFVRGPQ